MKISFQEKLQQRFTIKKTLLCIGLDPVTDKLPVHFKQDPKNIVSFCKHIIDATADFALAYKPNIAFFECFGADGLMWLKEIITHVPRDIVVILDAKRGDIGSSSQGYATMAFDYFQADAITLSPYMGHDSLEPFFAYKDKGSFVLCRTSNPGADDFQSEELFTSVARKAQSWNTHNNIGLVVGATQAKDLNAIRSVFTRGPLLIPGVGTQGGSLEEAVTAGFGKGSLALPIINASRSIIFASNNKDFDVNARAEAEKMYSQMLPLIKQRA